MPVKTIDRICDIENPHGGHMWGYTVLGLNHHVFYCEGVEEGPKEVWVSV